MPCELRSSGAKSEDRWGELVFRPYIWILGALRPCKRAGELERCEEAVDARTTRPRSSCDTALAGRPAEVCSMQWTSRRRLLSYSDRRTQQEKGAGSANRAASAVERLFRYSFLPLLLLARDSRRYPRLRCSEKKHTALFRCIAFHAVLEAFPRRYVAFACITVRPLPFLPRSSC